jgi:hypothetical protein
MQLDSSSPTDDDDDDVLHEEEGCCHQLWSSGCLSFVVGFVAMMEEEQLLQTS